MRSKRWIAVAVLGACVWSAGAQARPEKIKPGLSYYSDEVRSENQVQDIIGEKNYEEVYQLYTYYEVIYDAATRVVVFKEYKRGDLILTERYEYGAGEKLKSKEILRLGEAPETIEGPALYE